jgi:enoyl-CoA hydratase/carnithine racemase
VLGYARAVEILATGRALAFEEALDLGLLHYVYEPATFWEETLQFARQFCPPNKASMAVGRIKLAARAALEVGIHEGILVEHETLQQLYVSRDAREGVSAFLQKRQAKYEGH